VCVCVFVIPFDKQRVSFTYLGVIQCIYIVFNPAYICICIYMYISTYMHGCLVLHVYRLGFICKFMLIGVQGERQRCTCLYCLR